MIEKLCAGHETEILLLLVILVISIGKGAGILLLRLLKSFFGHGEVNVNLEMSDREVMAGDRQAMAGDRLLMAGDRAVLSGHACRIPEDCPKHGEESLRSLQNQKEIAEVKATAQRERDLFWRELRAIRKGVTCITNGLLAKQIIDPRDVPQED